MMKSDIKTVIDQPYRDIESFTDFSQALQNAHADVSFLGWRYVYVNDDNYIGEIYLDTLIKRAGSLTRQCFMNPKWDGDERLAGKQLIGKLVQLENECVNKIRQKWLITRIFLVFHDLFHPDTCRWEYIKDFGYSLRTYTEEQYKECFGQSPNESDRKKSYNSGPDYWIMEEADMPKFRRGFRWSWYDSYDPADEEDTLMPTTSDISAIINQPYYRDVDTFKDVSSALQNAHADVTFFGWKYVCSEGYSGRVYLDTLIRRVSHLAYDCFEQEWGSEERKVCKSLHEELVRLDNECNDKIKRAWHITRFFLAIRDFFHSDAYSWNRIKDRGYFLNLYTEKQYKECFGKSPDESLRKRSYGDGHDYWVVEDPNMPKFQKGYRMRLLYDPSVYSSVSDDEDLPQVIEGNNRPTE